MTLMGDMLSALLLGAILCGLYFGGLWLTVKNLTSSARPVRLALTSFFVRLALLSAGFIYIMDGDPLRLMACMTAFFIVRSIGISPMNRARES